MWLHGGHKWITHLDPGNRQTNTNLDPAPVDSVRIGPSCLAVEFDVHIICAHSVRDYKLDGSVRINCAFNGRSEEHTSELQSQSNLVCRLLLEKKNVLMVQLT